MFELREGPFLKCYWWYFLFSDQKETWGWCFLFFPRVLSLWCCIFTLASIALWVLLITNIVVWLDIILLKDLLLYCSSFFFLLLMKLNFACLINKGEMTWMVKPLTLWIGEAWCWSVGKENLRVFISYW